MHYRFQFEKLLAIIWFASFGFSSLRLAADDPIDFTTHVVPVLTKLGCNAGSCHGSAAGRGGFRLSLYGSRAEDDFRAIVRDGKGRRINHSDFEKSLLLRKPGGQLDHGGDQRFELDDDAGKILSQWIRQGAEFNASSASLIELDVGRSPLLLKPDRTNYQFRFTAKFSDGTRKDVTRWTVLTSNDLSGVAVNSDTNVANVIRPGRHVLIARYLNQVKPIEILVPFYDLVNPNQWTAGKNFVDDIVYEKLNQLRIPAAGQTDDESFVRRVTLDLTGRLPVADQVALFISDDAKSRRQRLVRELLAGDSFTDYWTFRIAEQLRIRSQPNDAIGARVYHDWLRGQIEQKKSWKEIARALLLARGDSHRSGQANFFRTTGDARMQTEFVTESLMGVKFRCGNRHNHPLDHWTQDDYHGLAAIFARVRQARFVSLNPQGENIHARTGEPAAPRVPGGILIKDSSPDIRIPLAEWMLDDANPYFARAMVNRIWKSLMGRGLVEPVDDLRDTNPATHPVLLNLLADDFVEHDFDIRRTIARICNSQAYQRSAGKDNVPPIHRQFYANANIRALPPQVTADAICDVTGVFEEYPGQPPGSRAVQLFDSRIPSRSLDVLGRCARADSCESNGENPVDSLASQLHLMGGELINKKIADQHGILQGLIRAERSDREIVRFFYESAFSRPPTSEESEYWIKQIGDEDSNKEPRGRTQRLEDFVWSILNSKEFKTNH